MHICVEYQSEFQSNQIKIPETLASKVRLEVLACSFPDSSSTVVPNDLPSLRLEDLERNISLNSGSLKQLLPVSSNLWHRSNVLLTNANAACLAILLLELFPPVVLEPRQAYQRKTHHLTMNFVTQHILKFVTTSVITSKEKGFID